MNEGDCGLVLLADYLHTGGDRRRQCRRDELRRIGRPVDDIDLLRPKVLHHRTHASTAGADQSALRIDALGVGAHRDLGTGTGLTRDGHDRDGTGNQFRNLTFEQTANQLGMGAGHHDFRAFEATCDIHHIPADALTMAVTLSRHLFTTRQQRFDVANGHVHIGGVLHILLHNAGDQLALLPGERAEHLVVLGLAEQLADDLTRGGGGQTAEVARGVIIFLAQSRRRVRIILGRLDGDLILSPNGKASGTRIKLHTSMLRRVRRFQICQSQCFRECGIQRLGIDSLPSCELVHSCQVQFHTSKTSYMKLFRALGPMVTVDY